LGLSQQIGASSLIKPGVIDNTAARPASPYEGQMVYEKDTDMLAIWNGTAWRYIAAATPTNGTVLQVVTGATTSEVTNATTTYVDTNLTATITPKSVNSKILCLVSQYFYHDTANGNIGARLVRDSTTIQQLTDPVFNPSAAITGNVTFLYLDAPATSSAVTYKTTFNRRTGTGTARSGVNNNPSNISLMEIAG